MTRRWIGSADIEITDRGEQVVAHRSAATASTNKVDVTSAGRIALAANANRICAVLVNDSDTDLYIKLGANPAVGTGIKLNAYGGSFAITAANLYTGVITAICASEEAKGLLVTEF
ncbi:MAG: hypothetical protein GXY74_01260 [Phycisphaerae bacterium]|nr:hypothetical protein [Phycisphaerae bacterium]